MGDVIVDPDKEATWPAGLATYIYERGAGLGNFNQPASDLRLGADGDPSALEQLGGAHLLLYHSTRLLPHEVDWVRNEGLLMLTEELVNRRADAALRAGYLDADMHALLAESNAFAAGEAEYRENQVCFTLGGDVFREDPDAAAPLLEDWGGEAIYRGSANAKVARVKRLGIPTIIVAGVDIATPPRPEIHPGMAEVFLGKHLGLSGSWADVFLHRSVGAEHILGIWQPGSQNYDRFPGLPRG
jgi:hypothetical protein